MNIVVIHSSPNTPSNSSFLAEIFATTIGNLNPSAHIEHLYLSKLDLEHFSLKHYDENYTHEESFNQLQTAIEKADGIVIATPVWNFGVPAQLKNMIDRMGSFALDKTTSKGLLKGKPLYIIFTGGATLPAWIGSMKQTTSFVTEGLRYFGTTPVGSYFEPRSTPAQGEFGMVVDSREDSHKKIAVEAKNFSVIVTAYLQNGTLPLKQNLHGALLKFGEKLLKKL